VRVKRAGVTVRVRREVAMPGGEPRSVPARDMIRTANDFRDLPLRAAAFASRGTGSQAKVVVLFEAVEPTAALASAIFGAFDARGKLVAEWTSAREDLVTRPAAAALMLPPGDYRLRVASVDALGRSGAVDADLRVETSAARSIATSAIVLGAMTPNGFSPKLQFTPGDAKATVYQEVYGVASCAAVVGRLELAATAEARAIVGAAAAAIPIDRADGCILHGELDLTALPPADYSVRVEIAASGTTVSRTTRTLRKAMR
jgi:hypothetical protein